MFRDSQNQQNGFLQAGARENRTKENETNKIFNRFYSNRPDKFGEHSGLGLNIVKNLVELHNGTISARNNENKGANIEIIFPEANS